MDRQRVQCCFKRQVIEQALAKLYRDQYILPYFPYTFQMETGFQRHRPMHAHNLRYTYMYIYAEGFAFSPFIFYFVLKC